MKLFKLLPAAVIAVSLVSCNSGSEKSDKETIKAETSGKEENTGFQSLWVKQGFVHPESIILSNDSSFLYISNIGNTDTRENPDGFISKVGLDGNIINLKWVDKIRSPKGLCLSGGKLYVSAVTELLEIDTASGKILRRHTSPDVQFLNDVTSDSARNVYVSGMFESAIYKLDTKGKFERWFQSNDLHHPNGVLVSGDQLFIGGWGRLKDTIVQEDSVGHLFSLSIKDKVLKKITADKPGKLDGIQLYGDKLIVSSWKAGEILVIEKDGKYNSVLKSETSLGDILYIQSKKQLFLPQNFQNEVRTVVLKD
jgi:hypothetical protein